MTKKKSCNYCEGKGKTHRYGKKYDCPVCRPSPGRVHVVHSDKGVDTFKVKGGILQCVSTELNVPATAKRHGKEAKQNSKGRMGRTSSTGAGTVRDKSTSRQGRSRRKT